VVEGVEVEYVDISKLPLLNTDLEKEGTYPAEVEAFRQKILEADSVLFASPENNYSLSGMLKKHHVHVRSCLFIAAKTIFIF
jgi:NAD(P)H-dependent FMN reductase